MKESTKLDYCIQYSMCVTGGFMAAYAVLNHADFLASAQTANLIHLTLCITGKNFPELCLRFIAALIYMAGIAVTVIIPRYTHANMKILCVSVEMAMVALLFFFTENMNTVVSLYPVFFMMSMQWNSFPGADGFVSSSIFSTNNLRQFTMSYIEYRCDKDRGHLKKTKFFGGVLLSFHAGVAFSYFTYLEFAMKGVIFCLVPLLAGMLFIAMRYGIFTGVKRKFAAAGRVVAAAQK